MSRKWSSQYRTISAVNTIDGALNVRFSDGDEVSVPCAELTPSGAETVRWRDARVELGGQHIRIPAEPTDIELPWEQIRRRSDPVFRQYMARHAAEQAQRYIGPALRKLRLERGLKQRQVAVDAGMKPPNLAAIERGEKDITSSTLFKLLTAIGASVQDLARTLGRLSVCVFLGPFALGKAVSAKAKAGLLALAAAAANSPPIALIPTMLAAVAGATLIVATAGPSGELPTSVYLEGSEPRYLEGASQWSTEPSPGTLAEMAPEANESLVETPGTRAYTLHPDGILLDPMMTDQLATNTCSPTRDCS